MKENAPSPEALEWMGVQYKTVLSSTATAGALSIVDSITPPNEGPPRHVHGDADESFMILTGEAEFWLEGTRFVRGPGETAFIPRGKEHTFRISSAIPCRHLVIMTPGGFETFFAEMAAGQFRIPEDMAAIEESAARHHLTFTGPPLEAM